LEAEAKLDAEIQAVDELKENDGGRGRRMRVSDDAPSVQVLATSPKHLGSPPWHIELQGASSHEISSGLRSDGRGRRTTNSYLTVELTPSDVVAIFNAVLAKGLVNVSLSKPVREKSKPKK
jgi:hypothetical protein